MLSELAVASATRFTVKKGVQPLVSTNALGQMTSTDYNSNGLQGGRPVVLVASVSRRTQPGGGVAVLSGTLAGVGAMLKAEGNFQIARAFATGDASAFIWRSGVATVGGRLGEWALVPG